MSLATELRNRAEEALDRTATTLTDTVTDVTSRVQSVFTTTPSIDVKQLTDAVEGYRKAAQQQVDGLLHSTPQLAKVTDTVEGYGKLAQEQVENLVEGLVEQVRKDPRLSKVVDTVDERFVKPARARFAAETAVAAETAHAADTVKDVEHKQVELADADAPVQVKQTPAAPARKVPARKTPSTPAAKRTTGKANPSA